METAILTGARERGISAQSLTEGMVRLCVEACHAFLDWERAEVRKAKPATETQTRHRQTLKRLLRLIRVLHAEASDPEYPDRRAAAELEALIWRLNESWETFYAAMPEAEAEEVLRVCFPGYGS